MKTLKLDLDGKYGLSEFLKRIWILKYLGLRVVKVLVHDTVNGFHVRLVCDNQIDDIKTVLIQALLGSDYRRELCNLLKIERGSKHWNTLFKEKWATDKLGNEYKVSKETYNKELSVKVLRAIQLGE
jgi:hypothetical protein